MYVFLFYVPIRSFPQLKDLGGWIVMLNTNSNVLEMIGVKPIISGVELHVIMKLRFPFIFICE